MTGAALCEVFAPKVMHIGGGAIERIGQVLEALSLCRPLLVTGAYTARSATVGTMIDVLRQKGIQVQIFAGSVPNTTDVSVRRALEVFRGGDFDCVIAVGGGSAMDTAKAMVLMASADVDVIIEPARANGVRIDIPIVAVPTTSGSGSEVTPYTVLNDTQSHRKLVFKNLGMVPVAALIDYRTSMSMPKGLTAECGLDALSHAVEALSSVGRSEYTDMLAFAALPKIASGLLKAYHVPEDARAREDMMLASTQAAIAAASAGVGLVHDMSRPLSAHFDLPHGRANGMLLPHVASLLARRNFERYAECAKCIGLAPAEETEQTASDAFVKWLADLNAQLEGDSVRSFGIDQDAYRRAIWPMATRALETATIAKRDAFLPTIEDIAKLYGQIF